MKKRKGAGRRQKRISRRVAFERKVREWRRFLLGDEDYDWCFIFRVLRYKLERTRQHIVDHGILEGAPRVGREIKVVVDLLKRLEADKYFELVHQPFWKKYGRPRMIPGKKDSRGLIPVTIKYAKETAANRARLEREHRTLMGKDQKLRERDLHKALRLIEKHIWGWWD